MKGIDIAVPIKNKFTAKPSDRFMSSVGICVTSKEFEMIAIIPIIRNNAEKLNKVLSNLLIMFVVLWWVMDLNH